MTTSLSSPTDIRATRMKLFWNPASPYTRKVRVLALEKGIHDKLELVKIHVALHDPNPELTEFNPLMKLPTLVLANGEALFDSVVISHYLDGLHPETPHLPTAPAARLDCLRLEALADGMLDAGLLVKNELNARPGELRWKQWVDAHTRRIQQALDWCEVHAGEFSSKTDLGQIALACAVDWLIFRQVVTDVWLTRPNLQRWFGAYAARPSMQLTAPRAE